ncbi:hypothetical protein IT411_01260 [Candidatus Peregrinibacteria bacterium]|nr:hypothetical protein [Candidatus Peregrinibacteria bacterium]
MSSNSPLPTSPNNPSSNPSSGPSSGPTGPIGQLNAEKMGRVAARGACCIVILALAAPLFFVGAFTFGWGTNLPGVGDLLTQGTVKPPGDFEKFNVATTYAEVQKFAGENAELTSLSAQYVQSDGTLNLTTKYGASYASITYDFFNKLNQPPENAPPIGAGGSKDGNWYEPVRVTIQTPGQTRYMSRIGGAYNFKGNYIHQGMEKSVSNPIGEPYSEIIPAPTCDFKKFWDRAIELGAPASAVASIDYDSNGYEFQISGTDIYIDFTADCQEK